MSDPKPVSIPSDLARKLGSAGGKASAAALTPEQRSERSRKASEARWRRDLDEINTELELIPDCEQCGCPLTVEHLEHAVTVDTLIRSMPDGVE